MILTDDYHLFLKKKKNCWNQTVKFIWEIHVVWIYGMVSKKLLKIKNTLLGWFLKWKFDHVDHSRISILVADFDSFQIFCGFKWFQQFFFLEKILKHYLLKVDGIHG